MRTVLTAVTLALTLLASACGGSQAPEFTRADGEALRKLSADFAATFNDKNVDSILTFYTEAAVFMPPNAPLIRGKETLRSFYTDLLGKGATGLRLQPGDVDGHGPLAFQSGTYAINYEPPGAPATRDRGKYLFILRKMGDAWKFDYTIWSSDLPPAVPAKPAAPVKKVTPRKSRRSAR